MIQIFMNDYSLFQIQSFNYEWFNYLDYYYDPYDNLDNDDRNFLCHLSLSTVY